MNLTSPRNVLLIVGVLGAASGPGMLASRTVKVDSSCTVATVQGGDTVWRIAEQNNITLDVIARNNPHIPNLSIIYPGDEIVLRCAEDKPPKQPKVEILNAVSMIKDWDKYREATEPCASGRTCWTWQAIIVAIHDAGFRGNDLITMASIAPGESNRIVDAVGDVEIQKQDWGPSHGVFQIRTLKSKTGTGTTRDKDRLDTLKGSAESAFDLYSAALDRRAKGWSNPVTKAVYTPFDDWTCFLIGNHLGQIDNVRQIATDLGAL